MARLFKQTITAILQNAMAPFGNGVFMEAELAATDLLRQAVRTPQDRAVPLR
ncbi:hypothetical protein ACVIGA_005927 [Bradyrhizobium sp. USDA 3240]